MVAKAERADVGEVLRAFRTVPVPSRVPVGALRGLWTACEGHSPDLALVGRSGVHVEILCMASVERWMKGKDGIASHVEGPCGARQKIWRRQGWGAGQAMPAHTTAALVLQVLEDGDVHVVADVVDSTQLTPGQVRGALTRLSRGSDPWVARVPVLLAVGRAAGYMIEPRGLLRLQWHKERGDLEVNDA